MFADEALRQSEDTGLLLIAITAGKYLGSWWSGYLQTTKAQKQWSDYMLVGLPLALLLFSLSANTFIACAAVMIAYTALAIQNISMANVIQLRTPKAMQGRIVGWRVGLTWTSDLAGTLIVTRAATAIGIQSTFASCALTALVLALPCWLVLRRGHNDSQGSIVQR